MTSDGAKVSKAILISFNVLFLVSGACLLVLSALLLADTPRVLLSRLLQLGPAVQRARYPLFYYAALALGGAGLAECGAALLGCWGACQRSRALLGCFIALMAMILLGEAAMVALLSAIPAGRLLGAGGALEPGSLVESLQRNFGSPGHEQFTAALDLAQTQFACCGMLGAGDYEASWWRMQELGGRELRVPLTCCHLDNPPGDERAFLDPRPRNMTLCQASVARDHRGWRHIEGCLRPMEGWFMTQWAGTAGVAAGLVGLQLAVFASAIALCRRLPRHLA